MAKTQVKSPAAYIVKYARMPYKAHKRDIARFVVWVYTYTIKPQKRVKNKIRALYGIIKA